MNGEAVILTHVKTSDWFFVVRNRDYEKVWNDLYFVGFDDARH